MSRTGTAISFPERGARLLALGLLLLIAPPAGLDARADDLTKPPDPAELTGRDIYLRVLENSFESFVQESKLISGDRGGNAQESHYKMWFEDTRDPKREPEKGDLVARSLVQYLHPFDLRHSGYLVLARQGVLDDQFVYRSSTRRVVRVNLRGEAVFGTDFSFEDILPRDIEDASYERLPDEEKAAIDCYVVEAIPHAHANSEYSRFRVYVDKSRDVPILTRYWDDREVEIKELSTEPDKIERIEGVWVPKRATMRHLKLETFTTMELVEIDPNVKHSRSTFELRRLESH